MNISDKIPIVEQLFDDWKNDLGEDFNAYKNHVYRVINFSSALCEGTAKEREIISIASCFHDIGIWLNNTFDYIIPSKLHAKKYLELIGKNEDIHIIQLMISEHHKIIPVRNKKNGLVEVFRKSDLIDLSLGIISYGISKTYIEKVQSSFPNCGFHKKLMYLSISWIIRHPFNPLPMFKW